MLSTAMKFMGLCSIIIAIILGVGFVTGEVQSTLDAFGAELPFSTSSFNEQRSRLTEFSVGDLDAHFNNLGK